jgi:hypothetical protein
VWKDNWTYWYTCQYWWKRQLNAYKSLNQVKITDVWPSKFCSKIMILTWPFRPYNIYKYLPLIVELVRSDIGYLNMLWWFISIQLSCLTDNSVWSHHICTDDALVMWHLYIRKNKRNVFREEWVYIYVSSVSFSSILTGVPVCSIIFSHLVIQYTVLDLVNCCKNR